MNEIKFIHVRYNKDYDSIITGRDKRNVAAKGGITIAYSILLDRVVASTAICSAKDGYNKKIGAAIAKGRISKSALVFPASVFRIENNKFYDVTDTLVNKVLCLS